MTGEELYRTLQSIWGSPANFAWGVVPDSWDELGDRRRLAWDRCAAAVSAMQRSPTPIETVASCDFQGTLKEITDMIIDERLKAFDGCRRRAAESLGLSLKCLYNRRPVTSD